MTPELTYFIKINLAFVLLYGFYRLFFYKDTYFKLRRLVLLSFFAVAFLYPLFNIQEWVKAQEPIADAIYTYSAMLPEVVVGETETTSWTQIATKSAVWVYLAVVGGLLIRFLIQLAGIAGIARRSKRVHIRGFAVYALPSPSGPFSFLHLIFIYPQAHSEKELEEILLHEHTHVVQWHSFDVVLTELITILCWINPFIWLLKREVRHNLEYLADNTVIHAGYDSKAYQFHLLGLTHYHSPASIYNNFNILDIKNRIIMMNKKRSGKIGRTKYLVFLPLMLLLMVLSNIEAVARITKELALEIKTSAVPVKVNGTVVGANGKPIVGASVVVKGGNVGTLTDKQGNFVLETNSKAIVSVSLDGYVTVERSVTNLQSVPKITLRARSKSNPSEQVFTIVEHMPKFPGGEGQLMEFLSKNLVYPKEAKESGIQGRVIVQFVVEKDGAISNVNVVRGIEETLNAEAIRVVKMSPKWIPGTQRDVPVAVKYTVPVAFRINGKDSEEKEQSVYNVVDEMPKFPGGDGELMAYLAKVIVYPPESQKAGLQGRVIASFTVLKTGKLADIEIVRGVSADIDEEAIRVLKSMPDWTPGKHNGQLVNVKYTVPITFRLQ